MELTVMRLHSEHIIMEAEDWERIKVALSEGEKINADLQQQLTEAQAEISELNELNKRYEKQFERMPEIELMRQQLTEANRRGEWQPIETAPKDGTEVLLCSGCRDVGLCYWRDDHIMTGWTWGLGKAFNNASHWMPLPAPPTATSKRGGE
jgi:TolA-binding protein